VNQLQFVQALEQSTPDDGGMGRRHREGEYSSAGLVVAGDDNVLLLHGQRHGFEGRVVVFKDTGVEAVLWRWSGAGLVIAQRQWYFAAAGKQHTRSPKDTTRVG
jgi:hypothetical protein